MPAHPARTLLIVETCRSPADPKTVRLACGGMAAVGTVLINARQGVREAIHADVVHAVQSAPRGGPAGSEMPDGDGATPRSCRENGVATLPAGGGRIVPKAGTAWSAILS